MTSTSILNKLSLPNYRTPQVISSLLCTVHTVNIPTIQYTRFPLNIHSMPSINLHNFPHHSVKTHHNSQPSKDKHIFITPCLCGENPNVPTSLWKHPGWGGLWSFKSPRTSSPNQAKNPTPLKFPLSLIKSPIHYKKRHSFIPCIQTSFIPLTNGISVSFITKNSIFWRDWHRRINFFNPTDLINSSTPRLTTLHITKKSVIYGQTGAYTLNHISVNAYSYL